MSDPEDQLTIVLVHGAWHGPWCWYRLRSALHTGGRQTTAPQLPSAGPILAGQRSAGLRDNIAALSDHFDEIAGSVVPVAHSYGGMPATEVAVLRPAKVVHVIYVAAYAPRSGQSLFASTVHRRRKTWAEPSRSGRPDPHVLQRCRPRDRLRGHRPAAAAGRLVLERAVERADLRATPIIYVLCTQDHALPAPLQEAFAARSIAVMKIDSGHSRFLSQPAELAIRIDQALVSAGRPGHRRTPSR